jgi:hypothetical protein
MAQLAYEKEITGLIVIDPYNDFISVGGKVWDRLKGVAEGNNCIPHMLQVLNAARKADIRVFYALHRRYRPGDYESWKYVAPIQKAAWLPSARLGMAPLCLPEPTDCEGAADQPNITTPPADSREPLSEAVSGEPSSISSRCSPADPAARPRQLCRRSASRTRTPT